MATTVLTFQFACERDTQFAHYTNCPALCVLLKLSLTDLFSNLSGKIHMYFVTNSYS
uniref:Uncharacterized protein n=1 Tax=Anguilla anguilla TaxID=7936 RepID=A0A0E9QA04_ANGAN